MGDVRSDAAGVECIHRSAHDARPVNKGGRLSPRRMTDQAVYTLMRRRATEAGVARFSPHDCRRTFVGDLLENGVDLATVKDMTGHASVQTTARYDRRGEAAKKKASGALSVPYIARS